MSDTSNRPELPQSSAGKIRSLCDELARHYRLDDTTRDELRGHLEDKLAAYLSGEQRISEEDALLLVRAHFGDAAQVARRLKRESTASSFWSAHIDPARLYSIVLAVLVLSMTLSIPLGLFVYFLRQSGAIARPLMVPDWVIPVNAMVCTGYVVAALATLWLRRVEPAAGRRMTRILNYLLLPAVPFGTLLGIYGLLKVDRPVAVAH